MIRVLTIALSNFILLNFIDQANILGTQPEIYCAYATFAVSLGILQLYYWMLHRKPVSYLDNRELELITMALMLDPLWHAELFKQDVEFQQLGGLGIFMLFNAFLGAGDEFFALGLILLSIVSPVLLLFVFLLFNKQMGQKRQLFLSAAFCVSFFAHKYALHDLSLTEFMEKKSNEFWLYKKLSFTCFSPYYTLIGVMIIVCVFFLRNKRLSPVSQQIYKFAIISVVLKSMSLYQFDGCIIEGALYTLPLINKNLYFVPIYSSFVFLVVYPKLLESYKLGIVLSASYCLYLGLLWLLADFYKIRIFRREKLLIWAFFAIPVTIVVFSMFGRMLVLKILQESFELFYMLIIFVVLIVVFAVDRSGRFL